MAQWDVLQQLTPMRWERLDLAAENEFNGFEFVENASRILLQGQE
jgi:hypothetical protein